MSKIKKKQNGYLLLPEGNDWEINRRSFLKSSGILLAGSALGQMGCAGANLFDRKPSLHARFGMVTDLHYADTKNRGNRHYRESLDKLAECADLMNREKVDFLVELGDFKDQDEPPREANTLQYLRTVERGFHQFKGPTHHVLGNHDLDSISKAQFLSVAENTGVDGDRSYYAFDAQGLRFIVLDANYRSDGKDYDHGDFDYRDANIPAKELDWLEASLAHAPGPAVVFIHQPLGEPAKPAVKNSEEVREVLERSGKVLAVFQGHRHNGGYREIQGIHYYTLKAVVEGSAEEDNAYAIVEVFPTGDIAVTGYRKAATKQMA